MDEFSHIILQKREEKEVSEGFPWVFDNEIDCVKWKAPDGSGVKTTPLGEAQVDDGSLVEVFARSGTFLGSGILNKKSKIAVRIIGREHADRIMKDTRAYWGEKVRTAVNMRRWQFLPQDSCRLIFAEADGIPGCIVEKYVAGNDVYLVVQFLALAAEVFREDILFALIHAVHPRFIYERSEAALREKEGLEERCQWLGKKGEETITITENGLLFAVDIVHGQKTGYFLDQKDNRLTLQRFCKGKRVLDAFSHTGAFGLNAFKGGAREVLSVDISEESVHTIEKNIALNKAQHVVTARCADVFDVLRTFEKEERRFDVIVLDPPAFTKSAKQIQKAYGGYKEINLRALRLLSAGGILVTCSCSYYFNETTFYAMLLHAARDSHRTVQILQKRGAAQDHPVLLGYPKSEYLTCAVCHVL